MSPKRVDEITLELKSEADAARSSEDIIKTTNRYNSWVESVAKRNDAINKDAALFVVQNNESAIGIMDRVTVQIARGDIDDASAGLLQFRDVVRGQLDDLGVAAGTPIMPKAFASQMVDIIQSIDTDVASVTFQQIRNNLGDYSPQFIDELRAANLRPEYVRAMYTTDAAVQKELLDISVQDNKDIKIGLATTDPDDVRKELTVSLDDYRQAYLAGGGAAAERIFNEQYAVIEKMALSRMKKTNISATEAVVSSIGDILPESTQTVLSTQGQYVVPMQFDAQKIETTASRLLNEKVLPKIGVVPLDSEQYPGYIDEAISFASLASTGMWFNNSTGDGLVLHYNVNDVPLPALSEDGSPFEVKFSDISNILRMAQQQLKDDLPMLGLPSGAPIERPQKTLGIEPTDKGPRRLPQRDNR